MQHEPDPAPPISPAVVRYVRRAIVVAVVACVTCLIVGEWVDDDDDIRSIQEDDDSDGW